MLWGLSYIQYTIFVFSNTKTCGRAAYSDHKSARFCKGNSPGEFTFNVANYSRNILSNSNILRISATILCFHNSIVIVKGHSSIIFKDCLVKWCANVCYSNNSNYNFNNSKYFNKS